MKIVKTFAVLAWLCVLQPLTSQELQLNKKDSIVQSPWIVGLGFNAVDDAGSEIANLFNIEENWNIVPFPSRLSIGRYFKSGLGLELIGTYNKYKEGKNVDGVIIPSDIDYFAVDVRASYDLNNIIGETGWFDPYIGLGLGYTDANNQSRGTYNTILGFRTWISDRFGFDFNSTAKWSMNIENGTNHLKHAAGAVYRFGLEKQLSKRGAEKLANIKEIEKEQQRIQDSVAAAQRAEEQARVLAERLQKEKEEAAKIAAEEKVKREAQATKEAKRKALQNQIDALGKVYFSYNSSYLTLSDKKILNELISILKENPNLKIQVAGHSDSRGSEKYNLWLSERRMNKTVAYLIKKGIPESNIVKEALGETKLTNDCSDGVSCPEAKHKKNRRSEFLILSL